MREKNYPGVQNNRTVCLLVTDKKIPTYAIECSTIAISQLDLQLIRTCTSTSSIVSIIDSGFCKIRIKIRFLFKNEQLVSILIAQTSVHYWYRNRSCLRLIICFGWDKKISFKRKKILFPKKRIIRCKQDLYWYQKWTEVWAIIPILVDSGRINPDLNVNQYFQIGSFKKHARLVE